MRRLHLPDLRRMRRLHLPDLRRMLRVLLPQPRLQRRILLVLCRHLRILLGARLAEMQVLAHGLYEIPAQKYYFIGHDFTVRQRPLYIP